MSQHPWTHAVEKPCAGCTLPLIDLLPDGGERNVLQEMSSLGSAAWPCERAMKVPQLSRSALPRRCAQKELYPETEARCLKAGHPKRGKLFAGAVSPMTPGRGQLINGRGRCFLEAGFCECFPPWRDALCDRQEMGDSGQGGAIIATGVRPGEEEDLVGSLWNWWESFNNQLDHPILVFHEGYEAHEEFFGIPYDGYEEFFGNEGSEAYDGYEEFFGNEGYEEFFGIPDEGYEFFGIPYEGYEGF
eukprot:g29788.t1